METYRVEYQEFQPFDLREPGRVQNSSVRAKSLEEAALNLVHSIPREHRTGPQNATITSPSGERYEVFKEGTLLVDLETGKKLS